MATGTTYYLAGPMSNIPSFNFPAFYTAAIDLRERGMEIVSPVELDSPEVQAECVMSPDGDATTAAMTWGATLARDVAVVADNVEGLVLLPGWEKSRGARLECFVALLCGHHFLEYLGPNNPLVRLTDIQIKEAIV